MMTMERGTREAAVELSAWRADLSLAIERNLRIRVQSLLLLPALLVVVWFSPSPLEEIALVAFGMLFWRATRAERALIEQKGVLRAVQEELGDGAEVS